MKHRLPPTLPPRIFVSSTDNRLYSSKYSHPTKPHNSFASSIIAFFLEYVSLRGKPRSRLRFCAMSSLIRWRAAFCSAEITGADGGSDAAAPSRGWWDWLFRRRTRGRLTLSLSTSFRLRLVLQFWLGRLKTAVGIARRMRGYGIARLMRYAKGWTVNVKAANSLMIIMLIWQRCSTWSLSWRGGNGDFSVTARTRTSRDFLAKRCEMKNKIALQFTAHSTSPASLPSIASKPVRWKRPTIITFDTLF